MAPLTVLAGYSTLIGETETPRSPGDKRSRALRAVGISSLTVSIHGRGGVAGQFSKGQLYSFHCVYEYVFLCLGVPDLYQMA